MTVPAILVTGPPASGKTVLGAAVARRLGAALLDLDTVTGPLTRVVARLSGTDDLDSPELADRTRAARYQCLVDTGAEILAVGTPVVLVAPFTAERANAPLWTVLRDRLAGAGAQPVLVWVRVAPEEILRRMRIRGAARDRPKLARGQAFLDGLAADPPAVGHLAVDGSWPLAQQVEAVLAAV